MEIKENNRLKIASKDIALIALLTTILFVQEELLTFIPNVQLTFFLLVLYSKKIGFLRTTCVITIHVVLDNLVMSSFSFAFTPAMFSGLMFIPLIICTIGRKTERPILLGLLAALNAFIYSWCYILPSYLIYNVQPSTYLAFDAIYELILAGVAFLTVLFFYKPCSRVFDRYIV